jgi:hypothetical protein
MTIFEDVGDFEQTHNELRLLLKDSVFNSVSNGLSDSKNLDMDKFEVLSPPPLPRPSRAIY